MRYVFALFLSCKALLGFSQKSEVIIATLNDNISSWDLIVNGQSCHNVKKGDFFYYYPKIETACSINRKSGKIPLEKVKKIDSLSFLRFQFSSFDLQFEDNHEDLICAKRNGIDYKELVRKAINSDWNALKEMSKLASIVDGAATEMFVDRFWKIVHFWSDEELSKLLKNDSGSFKSTLSDLMRNEFATGFTGEEMDEYLGLFYPKTLILISESTN